jgi:site-specific recombinase XerD
MKIKNKHYNQFLKEGIIETISEDKIKKALDNVKGKFRRMGRAMLIIMYYTGARPNEIIQLRGEDIGKKGQHITVKLKGSKRGLPRTIYLPYKRELVKEFYNYAMGCMPDMFLFWFYQNRYIRYRKNKKGEIKEYEEITGRIRHYVRQWFKGVFEDPIPPYFLRHNRFSKLMENGATIEEIRLLKGSRTYNSVMPYIHMSSKKARSLASKME